ncbi:transmembrane protease serine 11B-like protein [Neocloeon triangulifer]|uniref:transmembrane protease serine 11B-like protein n=1 Tax=Neocloeon triangulifer TaxID=2078957 RepID=UPI00286F95EB|nr:transmembrane protease serine 11B-like protein [Neocloeon triangulifer]
MKFKLTGWIWLLTAARFFAFGYGPSPREYSDRKIKKDQCWNYGKNKSVLNAHVFNFDDDNLSFENCGKWDQKNYDEIPPWVVRFDKTGCDAIILSDQTIMMTEYCSDEAARLRMLEDQRTEPVFFGGECINQDKKFCFKKRGLLSLKVHHDQSFNKIVGLKIGSYYVNHILLLRVEKLRFTPSLQPVCLWNQDNQNDAQENFFYYNGTMNIHDNILPEDSCYQSDVVRQDDCDLYGNSISTSKRREAVQNRGYLFINRNGRFYLRGINNIFSEHTLKNWLDLLPVMRQIVSNTADLAVMPEISKLQEWIDFGQNQSFPNCGYQERRRRDKRDDDKNAHTHFILGGQDADSGQFPWHASLSFIWNTYELVDFCGATLISRKTLITAAHCLFHTSGLPREASALEVTLGMRQISKDEEFRQIRRASKVIVHPGYNHRNDFGDDIALIILAENVQVTAKVRPICLWNSNYDLNKIANGTGTVVGWGRTSDDTLPDTLQRADLKIVSYQECYQSSRLFMSENLHPRENFCAGYPHNQTGACKGDSGGGLYIRESGRYFLRGVVSSGIKKLEINKEEFIACDPNSYSLFTDVTNYMQWIVDKKID